jgi:outer membrane protein
MRLIIIALALLVAAQSTHAQKKQWTLRECVEYALKNNISIQSSGLDITDSEWQIKGARGNFLPTASANANHNWNTGLTQNITTGVLEDQTTQNTSIGLSLGVTIFNGLQNQNQMHRANLALLASQYQLEDMKDNISLMVANSFLQILFNQENLKVLRLQYNVTLQEIDRTKELIQSGIVPPGDILEIEATAASQEQQIVNAENAVRISKIGLSQLLQLKDYENFEIANETYDIPASEVMSSSPDEIFSKALDTRYSIKIAQTNVQIAEKDYEIAKGGYYPTLSGFYSFNSRASNRDIFVDTEVNSENPTQPIGFVEGSEQVVLAPNFVPITGSADPLYDQFKTNRGHSFGFQLNVPIFTAFRNEVNTQRSRLSMERARLNMEQAKVDLESNVHQAYNDASGALKAYHAAEKTKIARQEAFKYAEERHNVGVINSFEYQQTKQLLESAESDVVRTKYDYIFKLKILEFYFGIPIGSDN